MQGSSNPLIIRNYRTIAPQGWKYFNLGADPTAYPGRHLPNSPISLIFKVEAAPVVLPYESELILKFTFLEPENSELSKYVSNQWTPNPRYRIKAKSMAHIIERCWAMISNMTFQSVKPPFYLNEILLRKPAHVQMKYPDNYTGEKIAYLSLRNLADLDVSNNQGNYVMNADPMAIDGFSVYLEPLSRSCPNEGQLYFMTPQMLTNKKVFGGTTYNENTLTFRIPLTELLPVFKIGVIPLIMIAANSFDLLIDLYNPADWFVNNGIGQVVALETWLNVSTVSFPDINPLAEMLIRPRIYDGRFIAPYLDYFTFEKTYTLYQPATVWDFNIIQALRNVPFISISFNDETEYNLTYKRNSVPERFPKPDANGIDDGPIHGKAGATNVSFINPNKYFMTGMPGLTHMGFKDRERGGFFSLPPGVQCDDLKIMLGESAFPLTQMPINWDDMYMYNRKHFEMYGRAHSGDGTFFFDLSHSPMTGFSINSGSPLQLVGVLNKKFTNTNVPEPTIKITVTCYYTNNFNAMLASGGVVPLQ